MKNLIFFLFLGYLSYGQSIQGVVLDAKTNKPIQEAHVYTTNIEQGTTTNYRGKFRLKFSDATTVDSIYVSHIGYKKKAFPYYSKKNKYIIFLESEKNQLKEVHLTDVNRNLNLRLRYNKLTSMKKGRHSFGSFLKDDKIYVVGGNITYEVDEMKKVAELNPDATMFELIDELDRKKNLSQEFYRGDLLVYDLNLDFWQSEDVKFRKRAYHNLHFYKNTIYVLGGKRLSMGRKYEYLDDKIEMFDNEKQAIQVDNTNPHQAVDFASFTYNDKIIVMGGSVKKKSNGLKEYTNKVHAYDLESGLWYELASMPIAKETSGVLIDNTVYLFGGFNRRPLNSIESFNLLNGKWKNEGELFQGFTKPAITYNNNIVYAYEDGKMVTFNIITKELNQYLINLDLKESELFYSNGKLYVLGGFREDYFSKRPSADLFSIDLNEFETTKVFKSKSL